MGVRGRLVAIEGGVSYEKDERVFSEGPGVSGVACVSLSKDCAGWGGMIASLSSGGGAVDGDGDRRSDVLPKEKINTIQLAFRCQYCKFVQSTGV